MNVIKLTNDTKLFERWNLKGSLKKITHVSVEQYTLTYNVTSVKQRIFRTWCDDNFVK